MRVVFIGVSHWHTVLYLEPVRDLPEVKVVGVSDPDGRMAQQKAAPLQSLGRLLDTLKARTAGPLP